MRCWYNKCKCVLQLLKERDRRTIMLSIPYSLVTTRFPVSVAVFIRAFTSAVMASYIHLVYLYHICVSRRSQYDVTRFLWFVIHYFSAATGHFSTASVTLLLSRVSVLQWRVFFHDEERSSVVVDEEWWRWEHSSNKEQNRRKIRKLYFQKWSSVRLVVCFTWLNFSVNSTSNEYFHIKHSFLFFFGFLLLFDVWINNINISRSAKR